MQYSAYVQSATRRTILNHICKEPCYIKLTKKYSDTDLSRFIVECFMCQNEKISKGHSAISIFAIIIAFLQRSWGDDKNYLYFSRFAFSRFCLYINGFIVSCGAVRFAHFCSILFSYISLLLLGLLYSLLFLFYLGIFSRSSMFSSFRGYPFRSYPGQSFIRHLVTLP